MKQYLDLLQKVLDEGDEINTERTGTGTIATFGEQLKFDLREGFPAVTTKKLAWKGVISELIWFLKGSTNVHELRAILHGEENKFNLEKKTIWDDNYNKQAIDLGYDEGYMGQIYGGQWRNFGSGEYQHMTKHGTDYVPVKGVDQVRIIIEEAKVNPQSRRLIVSAWNPKAVWNDDESEVITDIAALPPCHMLFQINIVGDYIDLQWYQRSCDLGAGIPFNCASYATLCHIFGRILNKTPRYLVGSLGNAHIYKDHVEGLKIQLSRSPHLSPKVWINPELKTLEDFENASVDDFKLIDYEHHDPIKLTMSV